MPGENNFFCWPLKEGVLFAAYFTSIVSMITCALAFAVFFRESAADDGHSKLLSFIVACYAAVYIVISRNLIHGIKDERRDKFICWIIMSIVTVTLFLSGIIFVIILFFTGKLQESYIIFIIVLGLCAFLTGLLGLSFVALIILGSRLHQVDKEAGFLQVILNTWFRESVPHPMAAAIGKGPNAAGQRVKPPMLTEQAQRTLLAFREDVRHFYRELDAARMTLILSIVFVGIFILSWWWMAFAIKQARSDGGVSLRTVLLLAVFAAVDVAASTGFILLRVIMYIRKDHLYPQEMRRPIPSLEFDQLAAYAALRLFTIQSSCGSIDILVIIVVGFLTGLRVYSVVCVFSYYKKAKNGSLDLFEHKHITNESDTSSRIDRLKIYDEYGPKVAKYGTGKRSGPYRGDRSRIGSVTGSTTFDEEPPELKIQAADMPLEMQRSAVFSATQAIKLYSTEKHIAESIKQDFDQMYHPTWHCIVGRNWGSCVTHSKQCYIRLAYKDLTILLYRST